MKISIKKWAFCILLLAFTFTTKAKTIAISYFDNASGDAKYNTLSKGIADMLITDLIKVEGITLVEREKIDDFVKEDKPGQAKYFDPATAQKMAKSVGAADILTGSFYFIDNTILIDARLIEAETGTILIEEQVAGNKNNFFTLHQQLANIVSKSQNVSFNPNSSGLFSSSDAVEFSALVNYSNAIEMQDQGMSADAEKLLSNTTKNYPQFGFAKNKLTEIKEKQLQLEQLREKSSTEVLIKTVNSLDTASEKLGYPISEVWRTCLDAYKYKQILTFNNLLRKMKFSPDKKMYGEASPLTIVEMIMYYDCIAFNALKNQEEIIRSANAFIEAYPESVYFPSIKMYLDQAVIEIEQHENGKKGLENKLGAESLDAYLKYLNRLSWKSNLQFVDERGYIQYRQLYRSQVLSVTKEVIDAWNDSVKFYDISEFYNVALYFNDVKTMEEIVSTCKKLFIGTTDERRAFNLDNKLEDYKSTNSENKEKLTELERIANTGSKEEIEKTIKWLFSIEKYNNPELVLKICDQYISNFKAGYDKEILLDAWEGLIVNTAKQKGAEDAKSILEILKRKATFFNDSRIAYERSLREIDATLINLENDQNGYLKYIKNFDPMQNILENYANIYKDNFQYSEEAVTRKQLIDRFKMDDRKSALQLFMLSISYFNLGYFGNLKKMAEVLEDKYPSSLYNESISSFIIFMPR